jgi:hypothetical protein
MTVLYLVKESLVAEPYRFGRVVGKGDEGAWHIVDPETGREHSLNDTAHAIWELCDGSTTVEEMSSAVAELTGIKLDDARKDVVRTVNELESLGLVRR